MSTTQSNIGSACLGDAETVVSWRRGKASYSEAFTPKLIICRASYQHEGTFEPASSMEIYGEQALLALRAAIDEALSQ
ncbi:MAG: hypothetical protein DDT31_00628 [Syntrophomonadaceae bacterium]|nr:hypothetical protein [Bacillota bacterium]